MKKLIVLTLLSFLVFSGFSQDTTNNWKLYPSKTDTVLPADTVYGIIESKTPGKVKVTKDSRIDKVSQDMSGGDTKRPLIKGYRIQVISLPTKATVDGEQGRFMSLYPGVRSYKTYKAPNFRLKVGNFRTKMDAQKFQNEIMKDFPNTLIISDYIELPRLD